MMPHWLFINGVQPVIPENAPLPSRPTAHTGRTAAAATGASAAPEPVSAQQKQQQHAKGLQQAEGVLGFVVTFLSNTLCHTCRTAAEASKSFNDVDTT
jgi:hypothetical protein